MKDLECDVAIIGGGTAGLAAERSARRQKAKTLLIDDAFAGTTCATVGCMPSKLLIAAGDAARGVTQAAEFGVEAKAHVHGRAVMARVRRLRDEFAAGARGSFGELPPDAIVQGRARFVGPTTLVLDDGRRVNARAIVIATGSRPRIPDAFANRDVLTNESVFELEDLPRSLAVVGAGPEGVELAQAFARLGVAVTLFDGKERVGGLHDEAVSHSLREALAREMTLELGRAPEVGEEFERILVAAGRNPAVKWLDLEKAKIALDEHGVPKFDPHTMQCGTAPIFLAGDVSGDRPVLHEASSEGTIAGCNAATFPRVVPTRRPPALAITFTDPSAATVGRVPETEHVVGTVSYEHQGRARAFDRAHGLVRIYAEPSSGRLIGASLVGPAAEHSAHLLALAVQKNMTASELLDLPFYHPTYEEGLKTALREICAQCHSPVPSDRDEGNLPGS